MSTRRIHECGDAPAFALAPQWILWVWRPCPAPPSSPTPGAGCWGGLASCTARANLADALFVAHCRGMQPSCRVDQPVDFTGALRPVPHGGLVGEVEPLPCDLRMIKGGGVAMARRDNPLHGWAFGERLDECTANAARTTCDHQVHALPRFRAPGDSRRVPAAAVRPEDKTPRRALCPGHD